MIDQKLDQPINYLFSKLTVSDFAMEKQAMFA